MQDIENRVILKEKISNGEISLTLNPEKQNSHMFNHKEYVEGKSYFTIPFGDLQEIINLKYATGKVTISKKRPNKGSYLC